MTRTTMTTVAIVISLLCLLVTIAWQSGFRLNLSTSYPPGVYRLTEATPPVIAGDLVLFCPPDNTIVRQGVERGYLKRGRCPGGFQPVIKKVAALAGTAVSFEDTIRLNGVSVPGALIRTTDGQGRALQPADDFVVPEGEVLMLSDHAPAVSFDSRYYGSVPLNNIQGRVVPVWLWRQ